MSERGKYLELPSDYKAKRDKKEEHKPNIIFYSERGRQILG